MAKQWLEDWAGEATAFRLGSPISVCMQINQEEQLGQDRLRNPGFQSGKRKPQNLWMQTPVGVVVVGETPTPTGEFVGETDNVLEHT